MEFSNQIRNKRIEIRVTYDSGLGFLSLTKLTSIIKLLRDYKGIIMKVVYIIIIYTFIWNTFCYLHYFSSYKQKCIKSSPFPKMAAVAQL